MKSVFGEHARSVMMSSTKSMTGHLLGAAGGLEAAICALVLDARGRPTYDQPGTCGSSMRPRFRSQSSPDARRSGGRLELVRVRGAQRDSGSEGGEVRSPLAPARGPRSRPPHAAAVAAAPPLLVELADRPVRRGRRPGRRARPYAGRPASPSTSRRPASIAEFSRHFRIQFNDPELLRLALTHRSYLSVTGMGPRESNERLEFLGDSVLGLVTSEYLYRLHPDEHEGQLTKTKSLLVSKAILSRRALAMGLGRFVLMSHSEIESGGRQRLSILCRRLRVGAGRHLPRPGLRGGARVRRVDWLLRGSPEIVADKRHRNYKSQLQEYVQSTFHTHPVYRIRSQMGPDHSKLFLVEVMVGRRVLGEGRGTNKKEAEQAAARAAVEGVTEPGGRRGEEPGPRGAARRSARRREPREERGRREPRPEAAPARVEEPADDEERGGTAQPPQRGRPEPRRRAGTPSAGPGGSAPGPTTSRRAPPPRRRARPAPPARAGGGGGAAAPRPRGGRRRGGRTPGGSARRPVRGPVRDGAPVGAGGGSRRRRRAVGRGAVVSRRGRAGAGGRAVGRARTGRGRGGGAARGPRSPRTRPARARRRGSPCRRPPHRSSGGSGSGAAEIRAGNASGRRDHSPPAFVGAVTVASGGLRSAAVPLPRDALRGLHIGKRGACAPRFKTVATRNQDRPLGSSVSLLR